MKILGVAVTVTVLSLVSGTIAWAGAAAVPGVPEVDAGMLAILGTAVSAGVIAVRQRLKRNK